MSFISAFSYIPYILRVIGAIGAYRQHKDESVLATTIGQILIEVTQPYHRGRFDVQRINEAVASVIDAIEKAV